MSIYYVKGDATKPITNGNKIIAHICNNKGGWGAGFVLSLSNAWSKPEQYYRKWFERSNNISLGMVQYVLVDKNYKDGNLYVANMIAQNGYKSESNPVPLDYNALKVCLSDVADAAKSRNASIHMPKIGCGLAGGDWNKIEQIIRSVVCTKGVQVYVYEYVERR